MNPAPEFFESSTYTHHLGCLDLLMEPSNLTFLKIFATWHTCDARPAVENTEMPNLCSWVCAHELKEKGLIMAKHKEEFSKIFRLNLMQDADGDGVWSTQESCLREGEDVQRVLTGAEDDTMSSSDEETFTDNDDDATSSSSDTTLSDSATESLTEPEDDDDMISMQDVLTLPYDLEQLS